MARNRDELADSLNTESDGGLMGLLAEEEDLDRRALWRLGSWAVGSIGALVLAILVSQSSIQVRQEQAAAADLARQSQQIQRIAKEAQIETNRLASAIDTLNSDRDRLYSRVTMLEQNVESVTGSIKRQVVSAPASPAAAPAESRPAPQAAAAPTPTSAPAPMPPKAPPPAATAAEPAEPPAPREQPAVRAAQAASLIPVASPPTPAPPPAPANPAPTSAAPPAAVDVAPSRRITELQPVTAKPPAPLVSAKSMLGPPEPSAAKLIEPAAAPAAAAPPAAAPPVVAAVDAEPNESDTAVATRRTEFGVDLGGANSVEGLRILWQRLLKSNASLTALRPLLVVKERSSGAGMQLRLIAGPIGDASTAAKLCAGLAAADRYCETATYDGQRLSAGTAPPAPPPAAARPSRKRTSARLPMADPEPPPAVTPPPPPPSPLLTLLGVR
ncbi:MAG TPA: hypothetical protein VGC77_17965 [Rhodopseudomonas sp.]|uniref:hypothetical protein n=1 Tax=Rhodopseudomonas sp. TaxID=1078 RepID=UPI002EDB1CAF